MIEFEPITNRIKENRKRSAVSKDMTADFLMRNKED